MTEKSKEKVKYFSALVGCVIFIASILFYYVGVEVLKKDVFPHYYDSKRHIVVSQNPDSKEIYAWKDSNGNIYTQEDAQVKNFTWGITALLLLDMLLMTVLYGTIMNAYCKLVTRKEKETGATFYQPGLQ